MITTDLAVCQAHLVNWDQIENDVQGAFLYIDCSQEHGDMPAKVRKEVETIVVGIETRRIKSAGFQQYIRRLKNERALARVETRHEKINTELALERTREAEDIIEELRDRIQHLQREIQACRAEMQERDEMKEQIHALKETLKKVRYGLRSERNKAGRYYPRSLPHFALYQCIPIQTRCNRQSSVQQELTRCFGAGIRYRNVRQQILLNLLKKETNWLKFLRHPAQGVVQEWIDLDNKKNKRTNRLNFAVDPDLYEYYHGLHVVYACHHLSVRDRTALRKFLEKKVDHVFNTKTGQVDSFDYGTCRTMRSGHKIYVGSTEKGDTAFMQEYRSKMGSDGFGWKVQEEKDFNFVLAKHGRLKSLWPRIDVPFDINKLPSQHRRVMIGLRSNIPTTLRSYFEVVASAAGTRGFYKHHFATIEQDHDDGIYGEKGLTMDDPIVIEEYVFIHYDAHPVPHMAAVYGTEMTNIWLHLAGFILGAAASPRIFCLLGRFTSGDSGEIAHIVLEQIATALQNACTHDELMQTWWISFDVTTPSQLYVRVNITPMIAGQDLHADLETNYGISSINAQYHVTKVALYRKNKKDRNKMDIEWIEARKFSTYVDVPYIWRPGGAPVPPQYDSCIALTTPRECSDAYEEVKTKAKDWCKERKYDYSKLQHSQIRQVHLEVAKNLGIPFIKVPHPLAMQQKSFDVLHSRCANIRNPLESLCNLLLYGFPKPAKDNSNAEDEPNLNRDPKHLMYEHILPIVRQVGPSVAKQVIDDMEHNKTIGFNMTGVFSFYITIARHNLLHTSYSLSITRSNLSRTRCALMLQVTILPTIYCT